MLTRNQEATSVAKVPVHEWFQRYGVPERVHGDQGRDFESRVVNVTCTTSRSPALLTKLTAMASASDSTTPCTVCCTPYLRSRKPGDLSFFQSSFRPTRPMHQLVSLLTSCCLDRSPDSLLTTCWDVPLRPRLEQSTGCSNIISGSNRHITRRSTS